MSWQMRARTRWKSMPQVCASSRWSPNRSVSDIGSFEDDRCTMKQHLTGNVVEGTRGSSQCIPTPDNGCIMKCPAALDGCMLTLSRVGGLCACPKQSLRCTSHADVLAEKQREKTKAIWGMLESEEAPAAGGYNKRHQGGWCLEKWLTTDSANACQPEPEKRLDHSGMSEHRCSFDHTLYCVSHWMQAQYHTTRAPCQDVAQTEVYEPAVGKRTDKRSPS